MVYARTKIVLMDYVFGNEMEHQGTSLHYNGKSPFGLYKKITSSFNMIFGIPEGRVQEVKYEVDNSGEKEIFNSKWTVIKQMDVYSYLRFDITLNGDEDKKTKGGKANISIKPRIFTEYPQDNIIQQNIFYEMARRLWHETVYENTRDKFIIEGQRITNNFLNYIKKSFNQLNSI